MPPSAIIDASLDPWSNDVYFVAEAGALWRTDNLTTAGAATWTKVFDAATEYTAGTDFEFTRIKATVTENLVYALGAAIKTGDSAYTGYLLRSSNAGLTWSVNEIALTGAISELPFALSLDTAFAVSNAVSTISESLGERGGSVSFMGKRTSAIQQFPSITGGSYALDPPTAMTSAKIRITGTPCNYEFSSATNDPDLASRPAFWNNQFEDYSEGSPAGPTAAAEYEYSAISPDTIYSIVFNRGHRGDSRADSIERNYNWTWEIIEWNGIPLGQPSAFDYARTNVNWVYVGMEDKIYKSEDGGFSWDVLYDAHGAHDICVDPQAAGAVYYWSTEGNLELLVAGIPQSTLIADAPLRQHGRIARQINGGMLWAITSGGELTRRNLGSWSVQATTSGGRGLISYPGGTIAKVLYVDSTDIYYSDDAGVTWAGKKGAWGWGTPVNAFLMKETE